MNFIYWPGEFRKIAGEFPSKYSANFQPCFSRVSAPPPPQKFTPKIVGIPLHLHIFEPNVFAPIFCFWGRPRIARGGRSPHRTVQTLLRNNDLFLIIMNFSKGQVRPHSGPKNVSCFTPVLFWHEIVEKCPYCGCRSAGGAVRISTESVGKLQKIGH